MSEVFDEAALLDSVDGDMEFLQETIDMLVEDAPPLLEAVRSAAEAGDAATIVGPAHTLKSMLGNFFAASAQEAARRVEQMGREGQLADVAAAVDDLHREAEQLEAALKGFLAERAS